MLPLWAQVTLLLVTLHILCKPHTYWVFYVFYRERS
nr:MAG TPA: hypothetical protein [Caudoviricetes sp.]